jgi:ubiquitin-protein ligase
MFPRDYPFHPFQMRLLTPLYHPTVGPGGAVGVIGFDPYASREIKLKRVLTCG